MAWNNTPATPVLLPSGEPSQWIANNTPDGKTFYHNIVSKVSTWEKPEDLKTQLEIAIAKLPWKEYSTAEGKKYFYNTTTQKTTWEIPPDYKDVIDAHTQDGKLKSSSTITTISSNSPSTPTLTAPSLTKPAISTSGAMTLSNYSTHQQLPTVPKPIIPVRRNEETVEYKTKAEAEAAFKKLLDETGVKVNWTWEQTMRAIISNPKYLALKTLQERKQSFRTYVEEKRKREEEEFRTKLERSRAGFLELLKNHKEVTSATRWRKAIELFGNQESFKFLSQHEREQIFDDHIEELRRREKEDIRIRRKENMEKFRKIIYSLKEINITTTWKDAQEMYQKSMDYIIDTKLQAMDPIDFLSVFEEYMKQIESDYFAVKRHEQDAKRRIERKNRETFKAILDRLKQEGVLNAKSKWKHIYPHFCDKSEYKNIVGQPGSTPLELFCDEIFFMDSQLQYARDIVMDFIQDKELALDDNEKFLSMLPPNLVQAAGVKNVLIVFEELQERSINRQEEERRRNDRKLRKKIDAFRHSLKKLDPPITLNSKWEEVRPRVSHKHEYLAIEEPMAIAGFDQYLIRLKEKNRDGSSDKSDDDEERRKRKKSSSKKDKEREHKKKHKRHASSGSDVDDELRLKSSKKK
ncbi:hypothetical protein HK096_003422, partial [Nowakowskiella sp. JEL0078]